MLSVRHGNTLSHRRRAVTFASPCSAAGIYNGLTITPANAVDFTLSVAATEQDSEGNLSTTTTSTEAVTVNPLAATVAVAINNTDVNVANDSATVSFTFSEAPTAFSLADTSVTGGTLSNLQQSNPR